MTHLKPHETQKDIGSRDNVWPGHSATKAVPRNRSDVHSTARLHNSSCKAFGLHIVSDPIIVIWRSSRTRQKEHRDHQASPHENNIRATITRIHTTTANMRWRRSDCSDSANPSADGHIHIPNGIRSTCTRSREKNTIHQGKAQNTCELSTLCDVHQDQDILRVFQCPMRQQAHQ